MSTFNLKVARYELLQLFNNNEIILNIAITAIAILLFFIVKKRVIVYVEIIISTILLLSLDIIGDRLVTNRVCESSSAFNLNKLNKQDLFTLQSYYKFYFIEAKEHQGHEGGTLFLLDAHEICKKIES